METSTLSRTPKLNGTAPDEGPDEGPPGGGLSLRELHARLQAGGLDIGYSTLSELLAEGDISPQLGVSGKGNRRAFPPEAAEALSRFLPVYRRSGARKPHAPYLLRRFLENGGVTQEGSLAVIETPELETGLVPSAGEPGGLAPDAAPRGGWAALLTPLAGLPAALRELTGFLRETRATPTIAPPVAPPADRLLNAVDAAALLACHPRAVSRYVKAVLPGKWRESDILAFIAGLGAGSEAPQ